MNWKSKLLVSMGFWCEDRAVSRTSDATASVVVERIAIWTILEISSYAFLLLSYAWMLMGLFWDVSGSEKDWFQRAGAVLVLAGVLSEFCVVDSRKVRAAVADFVKITDLYKKIRSAFVYFGFFSILLGTFVWAYGDLLISMLKS